MTVEEIESYGLGFREELFLPDATQPDRYHPRMGVIGEPLWQSLPSNEQDAYIRLYDDFYFRRHDNYWAEQKPFFQEGDETLLRPMRLEDVAEQTGYDISTISRVANSKYVETTFGTYPLKWFFTHKATQSNEGTDITARQIMAALRQHIEQEDKRQPLSDERLTQMLQAEGFNIARRTIAKYREQMGIPVARMRK